MQQRELGDTEQVVRGVVSRVTFRNPSNGFAVLRLEVADQREQITVVGNCLDVRVGANLMVRGTFSNHPKFGKQLNAAAITPIAPDSPEGIEKYLGSGLIKGIGPKTAKRLVKKFGEETLQVAIRTPEKIAALPGVGKRKAQLLAQKLGEQQEVNEIMRFLVEHNVSTNLASRIFDQYGSRAVEILRRDPYVLARDMRGVGFLTADSIAMNLGLSPDSAQRLKAGLHYALEQSAEEGHCFLAGQLLAQRSRSLLGLSDEHSLEAPLQSLINEGYVIRDEDSLYLKHLFRAEEFVASFVAKRCSAEAASVIDEKWTRTALEQAGAELKVEFSPEQREAVQLAAQHRLLIVTGGPGCGKTTIIRALTRVFSLAKKRILLGAPTGRAAQRMAQVCAMPASTIHRMLRYDPHRREFLHGMTNPLPADVVIIDEASMIDVLLARDLFSAISAETTLILVGDKDQLPSVGPGRVFGDLVALREVKTVSLSRLFRRSSESTINSIAHMINSGVVPDIPEPDGVTKVDAYFIVKGNPEEAAITVENLAGDQLARKFDFEPHEITVLTPSNRGPLGTLELNRRLQRRFNPNEDGPAVQIGDTRYAVGDRVCQRVNNYNLHEAGVFNGDMGQIVSIEPAERSLVVEMWDGRLIKYEQSDLGQLSLAYALSVHRSQGSEIPCVVLALHESHFNLLERQLLYTAVTRAKKLLVVVGSRRALAIATKRTESKRRATALRERVQKLLS